jgi:hypothetical protein
MKSNCQIHWLPIAGALGLAALVFQTPAQPWWGTPQVHPTQPTENASFVVNLPVELYTEMIWRIDPQVVINADRVDVFFHFENFGCILLCSDAVSHRSFSADVPGLPAGTYTLRLFLGSAADAAAPLATQNLEVVRGITDVPTVNVVGLAILGLGLALAGARLLSARRPKPSSPSID